MTNLQAPRTQEELAEVVKGAVETRSPLSIEGGATRPVGNAVGASKNITTRDVAGITLYEPGALTIVAKAGTPLEEITEVLGAENQHLPFEPPDYRGILGSVGQSTIGGVVAAGASGPRRIQAGAARDALIGVRFVNGEGEIIRNGGRVMKNVTGYDLVKLLAGSWGTLGILTELSFKILPKPETTASIRVTGMEDEKAVEVLAAALTSPFDVSGAAHSPGNGKTEPLTFLRVEGFEKSVRYRVDQLKELVGKILPNDTSIEAVFDDVAREDWRAIRDVDVLAGKKGALWRVSVKPSDGPKTAAVLASGCEVETLYDWGGGLVWLRANSMTVDAGRQLRETVASLGGHATLFSAELEVLEALGTFQPEPAAIARISADLRRQFDPYGILNPGRMAPEAETVTS